MKTEIKQINGDLYLIVPVSFVKPLQWQVNSVVDIEIVGNTLQMLKV